MAVGGGEAIWVGTRSAIDSFCLRAQPRAERALRADWFRGAEGGRFRFRAGRC